MKRDDDADQPPVLIAEGGVLDLPSGAELFGVRGRPRSEQFAFIRRAVLVLFRCFLNAESEFREILATPLSQNPD